MVLVSVSMEIMFCLYFLSKCESSPFVLSRLLTKLRAFSIYKKIQKIGNSRLGRAPSICHKFRSFTGPLFRLSEFHANIHGTGNKDEKSVNGTQIFHLEVSTGNRKSNSPYRLHSSILPTVITEIIAILFSVFASQFYLVQCLN